jgi:dynein light chain LC8-type
MPARKKKNAKAEVVDTGPAIEIKQTDMSEELAKDSCALIKEECKNFTLEKDIAAAVKKKFDEKYPNTTWHCFVGNHFGVSVTHATGYLLFVCVDKVQTILLFKSQE